MKTNEIFAQAREALSKPNTAIVIDVDGALADDRNRSSAARLTRKEILKDRPVQGAAEFIAALIANTMKKLPSGLQARPNVFVVTDRSDRAYNATFDWVCKHFKFDFCSLLYRAYGDKRTSSVEVKLGRVTEYQRLRGGVWISNDPAMLEAAEKAGFVALKASDVYALVER